MKTYTAPGPGNKRDPIVRREVNWVTLPNPYGVLLSDVFIVL